MDDVVIITGASGGMGSACARRFAAEGRALILADLHAPALESLAAELPGAASIELLAGDITQGEYRQRLVTSLNGRPIASLIHTAGVSPSMTDGRRVFAINFEAARDLVNALLPHFAVGSAAVLFASMSGQLVQGRLVDGAARKLIAGGMPALAKLMLRSPRTAYPLSKRAVQLYAQAMAPAFGAVGARIVSLSPGIIDTEMGRLENAAGPEMERMIRVTPMSREGRAEEIASVASFLASSEASYISGTDILVDGGTVAGIRAAGGLLKLR